MIDDLFIESIIKRRATQAELDALEKEVGPLPPSYRDFAMRYGYGRVNGLFFLFMPFTDDLFVNHHYGLQDITASFVDGWTASGERPGDPDCLEAYDDRSRGVAERWREFVFFGSSENGESFFWLETEGSFSFFVTDGVMSIRHGGDDLLDMIKAMQTPEVKRILGTGYDPLPPTFEGNDDFMSHLDG